MTALTRAHVGTVMVSLRSALTAASLTLIVGFGAIGLLSQEPAPAGPLGLSSTPLDKMLERHNCSVTGFDADVVPRSAVVRHPDGSTELVSFDQGWAVFNGEEAGDLVAVCLGKDRERRDRR